MITLDIRTLSIVAMITLFLLSAAMTVLWRSNPKDRAPAYWALGAGLIALGFLFLSLRAIITLFASIVLANGLISFGYGCFLLGVQAYARRPLSWWLVVALTAVQVLLFLVLTYVLPDIAYRIVVISLVVAVFNALSVHAIFRASGSRTLPELFTAGVFLANALFMLFRGLYVLGEERITGLMEASTVHAFAFLFVIFTSFGLGLGLPICMADRLNAALRKELRARDRFFSIVAHDLKNAFNNVLGFADLLNRRMKERPDSADEHSREFAAYIHSGSENAFSLASNLLDWGAARL